jgi:hypothetical protein
MYFLFIIWFIIICLCRLLGYGIQAVLGVFYAANDTRDYTHEQFAIITNWSWYCFFVTSSYYEQIWYPFIPTYGGITLSKKQL